MQLTETEQGILIPSTKNKGGFAKEIRRNHSLYLMTLPGIAFYLIFSYLPMFGLVIAFKSYDISKGILGSKWNELDNFNFFFTSGDVWKVTGNTLYLNLLFLFFTTAFGVCFAVMLNEIGNKIFKKVTQSVMFFPYFISWIIVGVISMGFFSTDTGVANNLLKALGMPMVNWNATASVWPAILVFFDVWKWTGYNVIIYLAVITGLDTEYYEAAAIDGASRLQQILFITLPQLVPTILILVLLAIGKIFFGDFGMIYGIVGDNSMLYSTTDVIDTYVFRAMRTMHDFGMSSAVAFYQSVMGFILVLASNLIVRKYNKDAALF